MKTGKALLAVLTGLAAGAVLGLIFSPQNGNENRSGKSRELADALGKRIDDRFSNLEARIAGKRNTEHQTPLDKV